MPASSNLLDMPNASEPQLEVIAGDSSDVFGMTTGTPLAVAEDDIPLPVVDDPGVEGSKAGNVNDEPHDVANPVDIPR